MFFQIFLSAFLFAFTDHDKNFVSFQEVNLQFALPNEKWYFDRKQTSDSSVIVYSYKREVILDSAGNEIHSSIDVQIEDVPDKMNATQFAELKRKNVESNTMIYNMGIKAVGFSSNYIDDAKKNHLVYSVYLKNSAFVNKGVQIIMDADNSVFTIVEKEFKTVLKTIRY